MFPQMREVTKEMLDNLVNIITFAYSDAKTSTTSTAPYAPEKLKEILEVVKEVREGRNSEGVWIVARHMSTFVHERFLHYYGQRGARLIRNESVHSMEDKDMPSYWFTWASAMLFFEPETYLKGFKDMYVDNMINEVRWQAFWKDMRSDWEKATTPVTVLLSANVGLLAISSIDQPEPGQIPTHRSVAQIASYVSAILSLVCYMICWILSRQHRPGRNDATAYDAISYLAKRQRHLFGLEADSLICSLPSGLFTWSMLTFLVAICFVFLNNTADWVTKGIMITVLTSMALITAGVLKANWEPTARSLYGRTKDNIINAIKAFRGYVSNIPTRIFLRTEGAPKPKPSVSNTAV